MYRSSYKHTLTRKPRASYVVAGKVLVIPTPLLVPYRTCACVASRPPPPSRNLLLYSTSDENVEFETFLSVCGYHI